MTDVPDFEMDETIEGYEADLRELRARLSAAEQALREIAELQSEYSHPTHGALIARAALAGREPQ